MDDRFLLQNQSFLQSLKDVQSVHISLSRMIETNDSGRIIRRKRRFFLFIEKLSGSCLDF